MPHLLSAGMGTAIDLPKRMTLIQASDEHHQDEKDDDPLQTFHGFLSDRVRSSTCGQMNQPK
jgi:hypothetical protein